MASIINSSAYNLTKSQKTRSKREVFESINNIDDFLNNVCDDGTYIGTAKPEVILPISLESPSSMQDAKKIVEIYQKVYNGTYPFAEMLDPIWIYNSFSDIQYKWGIIRIKEEDHDDFNQIAGCYTWIFDFDKKVAYNRGFNILRKYHGKLGAQEIAYEMIKKVMESTQGKIDKWYNECVTDHNKTQWMSLGCGAHTQAVFLNKDTFYKKKMSDAMMVAYYRETLTEKRQIPDKILMNVEPIFRNIMQIHNISQDVEVIYDESDEEFNSQLMNDKLDGEPLITFLKHRDEHGYIDLVIRELNTNSYIKGTYTPSVNNIEKIKYQYENTHVFLHLLHHLLDFVSKHSVEYVEFFVPVSDLFTQRLLLKKDMDIVGYVPSWTKSKIQSGKYEDNVIISDIRVKPDYSVPVLTKEGNNLLFLIESSEIEHNRIQIEEYTSADLFISSQTTSLMNIFV